MYKILYIQPIHPSGMDMLRSRKDYEVVIASDTEKETLKKEIKDADVIVSRLTRVDAEIMECAQHLKAVCKHGVGTDNIDTEYCKEHGIAVLTTGDANSSTVAEAAMIAIGAMFRRTLWLDKRMREGDWGSRDRANAGDLLGKKLGIIGFGRIGKCLSRMASAGFNMSVSIFDPYASKESVETAGYDYRENLEELLKEADVVSIHIPLTQDTRGLIGENQMKLMRDGSFIVNYARGGIVDEKALISNLKSGHIAGAAMDAFEKEPFEGGELTEMEKVILSPHSATFTEDSRRRMSERLAEEIIKTLEK